MTPQSTASNEICGGFSPEEHAVAISLVRTRAIQVIVVGVLLAVTIILAPFALWAFWWGIRTLRQPARYVERNVDSLRPQVAKALAVRRKLAASTAELQAANARVAEAAREVRADARSLVDHAKAGAAEMTREARALVAEARQDWKDIRAAQHEAKAWLRAATEPDGTVWNLDYISGHPQLTKSHSVIISFAGGCHLHDPSSGEVVASIDLPHMVRVDLQQPATGATGADVLMGGVLASGKGGGVAQAAGAVGMLDSLLSAGERMVCVQLQLPDGFAYNVVFKTREAMGKALVARFTRARIALTATPMPTPPVGA